MKKIHQSWYKGLTIIGILLLAIIGGLYWFKTTQYPPATLNYPHILERANKLNWKVEGPIQDTDGTGYLFLDYSRNPNINRMAGTMQQGSLYVVETDSILTARQKAMHPNIKCKAWGKWFFTGDLSMIDSLIEP